MRKILYVDEPFNNLPGKGNQRSSFIWETLHTHFDADLLLIKTPQYLTQPLPEHSGFDQVFSLSAVYYRFWIKLPVYQFSQESKIKFAAILNQKAYEIIIFRRTACLPLLEQAQKLLTDCHLVVDIDSLHSEGAQAQWRANPALTNRGKYLEYQSWSYVERKLLSQSATFWFRRKAEYEQVIKSYPARRRDSFVLLPDPLKDNEAVKAKPLPKTNTSCSTVIWAVRRIWKPFSCLPATFIPR